MATSSANLADNLTYKQVKRLEILLVSLLPATAILIIGAVGTTQRTQMHPAIFVLVFLLCALAVFFGERLLILKLQQVVNTQLEDITLMCHEFMAGQKDRRVLIKGDDELATLAHTMNALLDQQQLLVATETTRSQKPAGHLDVFKIGKQLEHLVEQLRPALDGDLRVKADIPHGDLGTVAEICNSLVEKLVLFTRWTLYSSNQILDVTRQQLKYSKAIAQKIYAQTQQLLKVNKAIEKLSLSVHQLDSHLHQGNETIQQIHTSLKQWQGPVVVTEVEYTGPVPGEKKTRLLDQQAKSTQKMHSTEEKQSRSLDIIKVQKQVKLQGESMRMAKKHIAFIESVHTEIDLVAQHLQRTNTDLLKTANNLQALIALAEDWQRQALTLDLPEEEEQEQDEALIPEDFLL